jgi:hypothetical protein
MREHLLVSLPRLEPSRYASVEFSHGLKNGEKEGGRVECASSATSAIGEALDEGCPSPRLLRGEDGGSQMRGGASLAREGASSV